MFTVRGASGKLGQERPEKKLIILLNKTVLGKRRENLFKWHTKAKIIFIYYFILMLQTLLLSVKSNLKCA